MTVILIETLELPPHLSNSWTMKLGYEPGFRMKDWLKLLANTLYSKLPGVGYTRIDAIPAGQVGGVTAFAATVTGVGFELPSSGVVIVMIPFEFTARADEVSSKRVEITDFMKPPERREICSSDPSTSTSLPEQRDQKFRARERNGTPKMFQNAKKNSIAHQNYCMKFVAHC